VIELSLHILDIVENSVAADADIIEIRITEDTEKDLLSVEVIDNGIGMDQALRRDIGLHKVAGIKDIVSKILGSNNK